MAKYQTPSGGWSTTEPIYGRAWTHPSTGEIRYYINNVGVIADSRKGKAWVDAEGQLRFSDMYDKGQAKVACAVAANPRIGRTPTLHEQLDRDFVGTMTRMMDEGWQ